MFDLSKLRGRIVEVYGTQAEFAKHINKTNSFVSNVLNGRAYLDVNGITEWATALNIQLSDVGDYFLCLKSHKCEIA